MRAELAVNGGGVDRHIRMQPVHGGDAFRAGQQAQKLDGFGIELFEAGHSGGGGVAGGQLLVLASFLRISDSLCCTSGWSTRWTWGSLGSGWIRS
jgi:hypothetical protein